MNATKKSSPSQDIRDEERMTKTIRLAKTLDRHLKTEAYRRTMLEGKRVTESDVIEEALKKHLKI
jgi:hypothetical protein